MKPELVGNFFNHIKCTNLSKQRNKSIRKKSQRRRAQKTPRFELKIKENPVSRELFNLQLIRLKKRRSKA